MECEVCGGSEFHKESGHFYCNECQTQSQQVQEHVFEQDEETVNKKATRKIQKEKTNKTEDLLTSWECYNYILKGLTHELLNLGAKPELKTVVRCLWMKYLHKCEVFDIKKDVPPKFSLIGSKKDVAIVYNIKKRKRKRSRTSSTSTTLSARRQRSNKKRALVKSQYDELSQSQILTQDSSLMSETLSTIKSGTESSDSSGEIKYNRFSKNHLKKKMSKHDIRQRTKDALTGKIPLSNVTSFYKEVSVLTYSTLYMILYIGLLITDDPIQLGDFLRFIREGHLSFGCYRHFFDEDVSRKSLNLCIRQEKLFAHAFFRQKCAKFVRFLGVEKYICKPDLSQLCSRYCQELNLPNEVNSCVQKFLYKSSPKMSFTDKSPTIPNYEGRVMAFILFTLKLLFGLDGKTEKRLSEYADILNETNKNLNMFNFQHWLNYIGYRDAVIKEFHLPNFLKNCDRVDSDMYLNYLKNQEIKFTGSNRHILTEVKDFLQVLDNVVDEVDLHSDNNGGKLQHSLTPYLDYCQLKSDHELLGKSFETASLEFILRPESYLKSVGNNLVKNGGANDNMIIEEFLHLYKDATADYYKTKKTVAVKVSKDVEKDQFIDEYLQTDKRKPLIVSDTKVLLANWQDGNKREFLINKDLLKVGSMNATRASGLQRSKRKYTEHYNAFERYWLNIPLDPLVRVLSKQQANQFFSKLPHSLQILFKESCRVVEQDTSEFFSEFWMTEAYLVYLMSFGCKNDKNTTKGSLQIRKTVKRFKEHW